MKRRNEWKEIVDAWCASLTPNQIAAFHFFPDRNVENVNELAKGLADMLEASEETVANRIIFAAPIIAQVLGDGVERPLGRSIMGSFSSATDLNYITEVHNFIVKITDALKEDRIQDLIAYFRERFSPAYALNRVDVLSFFLTTDKRKIPGLCLKLYADSGIPPK